MRAMTRVNRKARLTAGLAVLVVIAQAGVVGPAAAVEPANPGGIGTPAVVGSATVGGPYQIFETGLDHRVVMWTVEAGVTVAREDFGGYVRGGVGAAEGLLVVRGRDNATWYRELVGASWSRWRSLGGQVSATPAVGISQRGLRIVLARGTHGAVYEKFRGPGAWSQRWRNLGGRIIGGAAVGPSRGSGAYAFVRGLNNWLYVAVRLDAGWGPWHRTDISGLSNEPGIASDPDVAHPGEDGNTGLVVGPGTTGRVLDRNASDWTEGDTLARPLVGQYGSGLAGIYRFSEELLEAELVYVGRGLDGRLYARGELLE